MNPVVHFEMPYEDRERMARFYESVFGWQTQPLGEDMSHYVLATTTGTSDSGPKRPGAINGGFFEKSLTGRPSIRPSSSPWTLSKRRSIKSGMRAARCSANP
jgi:predicted enzyme related to lactoylglutathione lyase